MTTITHDNLTVTLTQEAYPIISSADGTYLIDGSVVLYNAWTASAVDAAGNAYAVYWAMGEQHADLAPDNYDWDSGIYRIILQ